MNTNYQAVKEILQSKIAGGSIVVAVSEAALQQVKEIGEAIRKTAGVEGEPVIPDDMFDEAKSLADSFKTSYFRNNKIEDGVMHPTDDQTHQESLEEIPIAMMGAPMHYVANALALIDVVLERKELTFK